MKTFRFIVLAIIFILAACNPSSNLKESTPTKNVIMRSGLWLGTITYTDERTMDMAMDIMLDASSISGEIRIHDESVTDIQQISGTVQGMKVQFKDEANRLYWSTLTEDGIEGFVGWECFDCSYWGTFELGYGGRSDHIDVTPFATSSP
jgi:hypothetical protein